MSNSKILVTGASGQLGMLVLEGLLKRGITNVIATTRVILTRNLGPLPAKVAVKERLLQTIRASMALAVPQMVDAILAAARDFSEGKMRDDLTLVVARGR